MQPANRLPLNTEAPSQESPSQEMVPADAIPEQIMGECWDVEGDGFILQGYRPPGEQMALRRTPHA